MYAFSPFLMRSRISNPEGKFHLLSCFITWVYISSCNLHYRNAIVPVICNTGMSYLGYMSISSCHVTMAQPPLHSMDVDFLL